MCCREQKLDGVFTSLALLQLTSPLYVSTASRCTRKHKHVEAALSQAEQHTVASAGVKCGALSSPHSRYWDRCCQLSVIPGYHEPVPRVSQSAS